MLKARPYQVSGKDQIYQNISKGLIRNLLYMPTGTGKCHSEGTPILMFDGTIKNIEEIVVGDKVMGPDSLPRNVLSLCRGVDEMFTINPVKGDSYTVNRSHTLTLRASFSGNGLSKGDLKDIELSDYIGISEWQKHQLKWTRTGVDFSEKQLSVDPYFVGLYLAEGCHAHGTITNPDKAVIDYLYDNFNVSSDDINLKHRIVTGEKGRRGSWLLKLRRELCDGTSDRFIPHRYKTGSREQRLELLAGLIDGDGHLSCNGYEIITKYDSLNKDILFLARSLGLAAYSSRKTGKIKSYGFVGKYHRIFISGNLSSVPVKIKRKKAKKRRQIKNVLNTGFSVNSCGIGEYYGFTCDGDHRYLLGDFSITHNSFLFSDICNDAYRSGGHVVIVVRRRELISQASMNLDKWKIPHGVHMAGHPRRSPSLSVQVCSIDTLDARSLYPHADKENVLVIIDECHDATPTAKKYRRIMEIYFGHPCIGFSATPFRDNSFWQSIVNPITPKEALEQGYLVPARTWVPNLIDTSGVKIKRGEFDEQELFEASSTKEIIGDFVADWNKYSQKRPTILFSVNVAHSKMIVEEYKKAGIRAVHADGMTNKRKRAEILSQFREGRIDVLSNVDIFTTGLDIPSLGCLQICRPTQSLVWWIQAVGRGLRIDDEKDDCIVIDNAGNTLRHGSPFKTRDIELGKPKKKKRIEPDEDEVNMKRCEECLSVYESHEKQCPECGHVNAKRERTIRHKKGELIEMEISDEEKAALIKRSFVSDFHKLTYVSETRLKRNSAAKKQWVWEKLLEKYSLEVCRQYGNIVGLKF